ncbi:hypothetical protein IFM89_032117 [Coptis chinensis]|uniref:Uncharacterized protein n=1 Tax=Coptis chinensis TaxID=261450 RepID=A0A835MAK7_9MAGN|nr:hypothetical protein IFM89_032117 [Coptis chinensis]
MLKLQRVSEVEACFKKLYELWTKRKDDNALVLVDMSKWFFEIPFNVITRIVSGKHNFASKVERYKNVMEKTRSLMDTVALSDAVPYLGWLDRLRGLDNAMKQAAKELDSVLQSWVSEHRQKRVAVSGGTGGLVNVNEEDLEEDFIDIMLSIMEKNQLQSDDPDTLIKAVVQEMILVPVFEQEFSEDCEVGGFRVPAGNEYYGGWNKISFNGAFDRVANKGAAVAIYRDADGKLLGSVYRKFSAQNPYEVMRQNVMGQN